METTEKLCPFRTFGPCPREQCMFWVVDAEACVLVVSLNRDEILQDAITDVENWKVAAEEASGQADMFLEKARGLEAQVASMVSLEKYEDAAEAAGDRGAMIEKLQEELKDARAELEALRAEGGGEVGGSKKPSKRKRK